MANTIEIIIKQTGKGNALAQAQKSIGKVGQDFSSLGRSLSRNVTAPIVGAGAALAGLGALSVRTASSFQSAFAGVIKTTDGLADSTGQLTEVGEELRRGFRDLAKEVPTSVEELLAIGELGGQLGIARENLLDFTGVVAALGETTNLATEEAATGFAQLANVMQTPQDEIENIGSAIVELGNNFATTERDILSFGQRIAGAGKIAGLTESDVLGIGAAFASVGVEAEAGGTAVQKVLLGINKSVTTTDAKLNVFATTAGLSAQDFAAAWEEDAGKAFAMFVRGLGRAGDDAINILADLGLEDQRLVRAFLSVANAGDLVTRSLDASKGAYAENIALTREAEIRYGTFQSRLDRTRNRIRDVGITIGDALLPEVNELLDRADPMIDELGERLPDLLEGSLIPAFEGVLSGIQPVAEVIGNAVTAFADLDPVVQGNIVKFGLLAAAAGPALRIIGGGITLVGGLAGALSGLPAIIGGVATAWAAWTSGLSLTTALGAAGLSPIVITLGAIAAAVGSVVGVWAQWNKQIVKTNEEGQKAVSGAWEDFFTKQIESGASAAQIAEEYRQAQDRVRQTLEQTNPIVRLFIQNQGDLQGDTAAANSAIAQAAQTFEEYQQAATIAGVGVGRFTREQFEQAKASMESSEAIEETGAKLGEMDEATKEALEEVENLVEGMGEMNEALLTTQQITSIVSDQLGKTGIQGEALDNVMKGVALAMGEVSQEQLDLERDLRLVSDALSFGIITGDEFNEFLNQAAQGTFELTAAQRASLNAQTQYQAQIRESAKAARELQGRQLELAQSLKDATGAQIAQAAIGELQRALEDGQIEWPDYVTAVSEVQETFGLADEKSRALAEGILGAVEEMGKGVLPAENFDEALVFIRDHSDEGAINMQELLDKFGVVPENVDPARESMQRAREEMQFLSQDADTVTAEIVAAFEDKDWQNLGDKVSAGIAAGITAGSPEIAAAARKAAQAALAAAEEELGIRSPSKAFMIIGKEIVEGLRRGIERNIRDAYNDLRSQMRTLRDQIADAITDGNEQAVRQLKDQLRDLRREMERMQRGLSSGVTIAGELLDAASAFSRLGSQAVSIFETRTLDPLRREIDALDKLLGPGFVDITARQRSTELANQRADAAERLLEAEEMITEFRKQQENLSFLQAQVRLLETIQEHGLDAADILGGLELGIDADLPSVIQAMSEAMKAIIASAEEELGIASPSKRAAEIGMEFNEGLIQGMRESLLGVRRTVTQVMGGMASPALLATPVRSVAGGVSQAAQNGDTIYQNQFTFPTRDVRNNLDYRKIARNVVDEIDRRSR